MAQRNGGRVMQLAGDITRQDIRDTLEAILDSNFWNEANRCDCEITIDVASDMTPTITWNTHDDWIKVVVATQDLYDEDGQVVGWTFDCDILVDSVTFSMYSAEGISTAKRTMERWSKITQLAARLAELEFYPEEYFD